MLCQERGLKMVEIAGLKLFTLDDVVLSFEQGGQKLTTVTLRAYIKAGDLKARKCGGTWFVTEAALKEFFESGNTKEENDSNTESN